jgi:hypothetical protein
MKGVKQEAFIASGTWRGVSVVMMQSFRASLLGTTEGCRSG